MLVTNGINTVITIYIDLDRLYFPITGKTGYQELRDDAIKTLSGYGYTHEFIEIKDNAMIIVYSPNWSYAADCAFASLDIFMKELRDNLKTHSSEHFFLFKAGIAIETVNLQVIQIGQGIITEPIQLKSAYYEQYAKPGSIVCSDDIYSNMSLRRKFLFPFVIMLHNIPYEIAYTNYCESARSDNSIAYIQYHDPNGYEPFIHRSSSPILLTENYLKKTDFFYEQSHALPLSKMTLIICNSGNDIQSYAGYLCLKVFNDYHKLIIHCDADLSFETFLNTTLSFISDISLKVNRPSQETPENESDAHKRNSSHAQERFDSIINFMNHEKCFILMLDYHKTINFQRDLFAGFFQYAEQYLTLSRIIVLSHELPELTSVLKYSSPQIMPNDF